MNENYILEYYQQIKDGRVVVGNWIRLIYERLVHGLEEKEIFLDLKKASRAVRFVENFCHHSKGKLAPSLVKLELWQKAMISAIFGVVDATGKRQYREVFVVMGRKCGKSLLASGIAEYMAYADGELGADVFFLAPKLEQADIVFTDFWQSISHEPDLMKMTKKRKMDIYIESTNTSIKKIAFSEKKSDGFNPHLTVCDEVAAWVGDQGIKQYGVMTSALGAREQPLILSITTANYVTDGIYDELMRRSTSYLNGNSRESRLLPFIYMIDDVEKWSDLTELQKSIPNLGVSVSVDYIIEEISKAEQSYSNKVEFLTKFCCVKQNSSAAWLDMQTIRKSFPEENHYTLDDFSRCYAVAGVDLSQTVDLTACSLMVQRDGVIYYFVKFFLPMNKLEEATQRDGIPYAKYIDKGWLKLSGDNFVNYDDCYEWLDEMKTKHSIYILQIGLDRYCAQFLQQRLENRGYHCDTVFQGTNLTGIINTTEGMMKDGRLQSADGNDLMKIHWMDSALKLSTERNLKQLIKLNANAHIDGVAATLDAMCMRTNVWEKYGRKLENPPRE